MHKIITIDVVVKYLFIYVQRTKHIEMSLIFIYIYSYISNILGHKLATPALNHKN